MKTWISILFLFVHLVAQAQTTADWRTFKNARFDLHTTAADSALTPHLISTLEQGVAQIEGFFNQPFPKRFDVWVFPDRGALDRQWQHDWNDSTFQSQCWMVASGVANRLDLLSLNAWAEQACEHRAADSLAVFKLLTHELTHVYHGQHCPIPDF
ncbi:MAG: hypothetical protein JNJ57_09030, partial [Saprospiraceae bacterium]|nr:hypothetical protein [Saprospiraceae bacterium]